MINFRFHLVSLVAVFLALALGVVMGSTVIDRAIVDGLRNRIDRVERNAENRKAENDELRDEVERLERGIADTARFAVAGRLADVPVVVVAVSGVDDETVDDTVGLLRDAGASAPVVLWVEPSWELGDLEAARSMADALGAVVRGDVAMRATAWTAIARRLAEGTAPEDGPDVLANLVGAGFLRAEPVEAEGEEPVLGTYPGPGARVLLVSGTGAELAVEDPVVGATTALVREQVPTVVGEVYSDGEDTPERGTTVEPIRGDEELASDVSTVDDLDLVVGRATVVLALEDLASGVVGHYGYGVGADRSIPGWTPP